MMGYEVDTEWKITAVLAILPRDLEERVLSQANIDDYDVFRDYIVTQVARARVSGKISGKPQNNTGTVPMEIGQVMTDEQDWRDKEQGDDEVGDDEEHEAEQWDNPESWMLNWFKGKGGKSGKGKGKQMVSQACAGVVAR